ncbi:MAG: hypothetical protein ABL995_04930 [Bryobacteraceae bacterium]
MRLMHGDRAAWLVATLNSLFLKVGSNGIAVEIHQNAATSSDISFDFKLIGQ